MPKIDLPDVMLEARSDACSTSHPQNDPIVNNTLEILVDKLGVMHKINGLSHCLIFRHVVRMSGFRLFPEHQRWVAHQVIHWFWG